MRFILVDEKHESEEWTYIHVSHNIAPDLPIVGLTGRFVAYRLKGRVFESRSSRYVGTLGKSFTRSCLWRFGLKLRHSIRVVSGAPLSSSELEEVL